MSIINNETFLPGVITEVQSEYGYGYDSSLFGTTDSVLVIGNAFNGPTGLPVKIYSPEHAKYVFGKAYDSTVRKEVSLVGAIEDAYQKGCRTIYALRVNGKEISKSFKLAVDTSLKLKVRGLYPSNDVKNYFLVYDNTEGDEKIKIYKPASKATIAEKMQGMVENENSVLVTTMNLNADYGLSKDSLLSDLISLVNNHQYNNVLQLSIVDENETDVTLTSEEAKSLTVGAVMPGAYLLGRDRSLCAINTETDYTLVDDEADKPYDTFEGIIYKRLVMNTDINAELPIYAEDMNTFQDILSAVGIYTIIPFDFLETQGLIDNAFQKDSVDYEEINMTNFELYQKLGSGYAITATAERREVGGIEVTPRIKETPVSDSNRIQSITDGFYSMLENLDARYRVLSCGSYNDEIANRIPRASDFQIASPLSVDIFDGALDSFMGELITVTPKIEEDEKYDPKSYVLSIDELTGMETSLVSEIYTDKVMRVVPSISDVADLEDTVVSNGTLVMLVDLAGEGTLYRYVENAYEVVNDQSYVGDIFLVDKKILVGEIVVDELKFNPVDVGSFGLDGADATYLDKKYILAENNGIVYAFKVLGDGAENVTPLGDVPTMFSENEERILIYAQSNFFEQNEIIIRSGILQSITLKEFVDMLNEHPSLRKLFTFSIQEDAMNLQDEYVYDIASGSYGNLYTLDADRELAYNYSKYIPYKTTDNFARQLAQHCTYTGLKTAPTHGVIGGNRMSDIGLTAIANKVDELLAIELDLYAKNAVGRNMLDRNNMPYPIGKNISTVFTQYVVNMDDGYSYISNGAGGYSGMISNLPLNQSSTNQPFALISTMFNLTNFQLTRLTQKGFVTIKQSFSQGPVITDGITMAPAASPFRRLSVTRIISSVEELIREAAEPYIGKQNHSANRNALKTAIKSRLDKLIGTLIENYDFNMIVDPTIMKFSYIDIDYNIVPIYEIREVRNRISVKEEL